MNLGRYSDFGSGPGSADFADPCPDPDFCLGSDLDSGFDLDSDLDSDLFKQNQTPQENQAQLILSLQRRLLSCTGESYTHT